MLSATSPGRISIPCFLVSPSDCTGAFRTHPVLRELGTSGWSKRGRLETRLKPKSTNGANRFVSLTKPDHAYGTQPLCDSWRLGTAVARPHNFQCYSSRVVLRKLALCFHFKDSWAKKTNFSTCSKPVLKKRAA